MICTQICTYYSCMDSAGYCLYEAKRRERKLNRFHAKRLKGLLKHLQLVARCTVRKCIKALQSLCRNIALCKRLANHPPQSLPLVVPTSAHSTDKRYTPFKRGRLSLKSNLLWRVPSAIPRVCAYPFSFHLIRFHSVFWATSVTFTFCKDRYELMCHTYMIQRALLQMLVYHIFIFRMQ